MPPKSVAPARAAAATAAAQAGHRLASAAEVDAYRALCRKHLAPPLGEALRSRARASARRDPFPSAKERIDDPHADLP